MLHFDAVKGVGKGWVYSAMDKIQKLERALLWVIHEQCEYNGKAYAKLLIHGLEAFNALGLKDECDISEIEDRLFKEHEPSNYGLYAERNKSICDDIENGLSMKEIANKHGITRARVYQIYETSRRGNRKTVNGNLVYRRIKQ